jgi:hypothetical protein
MRRRTRRTKRRSGGSAPVRAITAQGMQPSNAVMHWATTAGAPPLTAEQRVNVAHGGKRSMKHKKRSAMRRTRHKKRGGDCGCAGPMLR